MTHNVTYSNRVDDSRPNFVMDTIQCADDGRAEPIAQSRDSGASTLASQSSAGSSSSTMGQRARQSSNAEYKLTRQNGRHDLSI